jgi:hypothetical protein
MVAAPHNLLHRSWSSNSPDNSNLWGPCPQRTTPCGLLNRAQGYDEQQIESCCATLPLRGSSRSSQQAANLSIVACRISLSRFCSHDLIESCRFESFHYVETSNGACRGGVASEHSTARIRWSGKSAAPHCCHLSAKSPITVTPSFQLGISRRAR